MVLLMDLSLFNIQSTLVGVLVLFAAFWFIRRPRRNLPPGPRGWPVLGYLPQLAMAGEDSHVIFSKLTARYGNIISVNLAGKLVVILHGHATIKEAFNQHQLSARPPFYCSDIIAPGTGVARSSGETWVQMRTFCSTVFKSFGVGKSIFEENISIEAEFLINEMKKHGGCAFDPNNLVGTAISNVICSVVFGKRFENTDPRFKRFLQSTRDGIDQVGQGAVIEFFPTLCKLTFLPFVRKYMNILESFFNQLRLLVDENKRDFDPDTPRSFIDMFLREIVRKEKQGVESLALKTDNLLQLVSDLFVAGTETTTTTLRWSMLYMMAYPEVQVRVQKELDDVTNRNRLPRISDKPDLPYTEAVICEIQRICTILPLAIPHLCSEDTTMIGGFNIPKSTIVLSNLWHTHVDPTVWQEPQSFRPERFLDKDGKLITREKEKLISFGIGRRVCLGEHLAKMELFIFFTLLLHQFSLKKVQDAPVSLQGFNGVNLAPESYKVCAIPRG